MKNVFIPQNKNRDYCSKYIVEPKFELKPIHSYKKPNEEALDVLKRGGTVEIVLHDEDKGEYIIIETINKNKNIKPPTLKNKRVDEYIMEAKKLIKELHDLENEVYINLSARDNDYFIKMTKIYNSKLIFEQDIRYKLF